MKNKDMDIMSFGWRLWFIVCGILAACGLGLAVWAIISLVTWVMSK